MAKPPIKQKYIETPEKLWELFEAYVKHELEHPMIRRDYVGKDGIPVDTKLETPITFEGFECWVADQDIIQDLGDYENHKNESYASYRPIVTRIKQNCFVHNFKGAAVKLFDANLIAKKLGLITKTDNKNENTNIEVKAEFGSIKPTE